MFGYVAPIVLLLGSNVFMTFAWYGHLKYTSRPLWLVIVASWWTVTFISEVDRDVDRGAGCRPGSRPIVVLWAD